MRWNNEIDFIEVESGLSSEGINVLVISSSVSFMHLPLEFRGQTNASNPKASEHLYSLVKQWAERRGMLLAPAA